MWKKIIDWFKCLFGNCGPEFDNFADPTKPFMGYGLVNNWGIQNAESYMNQLVENEVQCMAFEFFEWSGPESFAKVEDRIKKFEKYVDLAKKKKVLLYVTLLNCNLGSGKYGDPGIKAPVYNDAIMKAANALAGLMKKHSFIYLTPCGEGGNQSPVYEKNLQNWCKANMPKSQLVNNWGSRPAGTDGMAFLCQHPSGVAAAMKSISWIMSDHGLFIKELNGGNLYGTANYATTFNCAKGLKAKNKTFIYYHFHKDGVIDTTALKALKDSQV